MATGWPMKTTYANGDVYSASDVNDTNGTVNLLTSTTLSLAAGKNAIINGGFDIWQRGTSFTSGASLYSADRWYRGGSANSTMSRQATSDTTNLPTIQYCARVQRNAGSTSTVIADIGSPVETANVYPYAGKAITLSYYARRGANFSGTSNLLTVRLYTGTGTDQNAFTGYTGSATPIDTTVTLTTTWQRFQHTITLGATVTEFMPYFAYTPVGTAGAADFYEVTGVQVELGSVATTFSRAGATIQGELAACQRYYWRYTGGAAYSRITQGIASSTTTLVYLLQNPVIMRITPTSLDYSTLASYEPGDNVITAITAATLDQGGTYSSQIGATVASGLTKFRSYQLINNNSTSAYIGLNAEL
jgi:hypothetical protein